MAKVAFTSEEFLALVDTSVAVKSMDPTQVFQLRLLALNPLSDKAKHVYKTLIEEQARLAHVEKTFVKITDKIMTDMDNSLTAIKSESAKKRTESAQKKAHSEDEKAAADLLTSLSTSQ